MSTVSVLGSMPSNPGRGTTVAQAHLLPSKIAALLSFSVEHLPTQSNEHALYPELPSCHCTVEALAEWGAQGTPGLDSDSDPEPGPEQPWQPTGPLYDAQKDPERHTRREKIRSEMKDWWS